MMNIWTICGVVLCALAAVLILREVRKEWTIWIVLCVMIMVLYFSSDLLRETVGIIRAYGETYPEVSGYTAVLLKGLGIACISYTAGEICKAAGENGMAGYVELAGKIELILLGLPVFQEILSIAIGLL